MFFCGRGHKNHGTFRIFPDLKSVRNHWSKGVLGKPRQEVCFSRLSLQISAASFHRRQWLCGCCGSMSPSIWVVMKKKNPTDWVAQKQQKFISLCSGGWESMIKALQILHLARAHFLLVDKAFPLCPRMGKGARGLSP